ncbi:MAG: hypothetical protein QOG31_681 [Thermoplasmata archaeon]|nr:hypothetical protein [Thermoplasmata archaeon]
MARAGAALALLVLLPGCLLDERAVPGSHAPAFAALGLDGAPAGPDTLAGKVGVLHLFLLFSNRTVVPQTVHVLQAAYANASRADVAFLSVGIEPGPGKAHSLAERLAEAQRLRDLLGIPWPVAVERPDRVFNGAYHPPHDSFSYVLGRDGTIRATVGPNATPACLAGLLDQVANQTQEVLYPC